ncbi:DUF1800 domain-containing protein [Leeia aquatica]|uniref:DUF1800 domain-containing protein n=1 Tax=Leeia aquatica TaxID=2725557 RepID=A0A847SDI1_9NEIS|nr:DUF1800 domain-containing protein [Leeia aquatica]NLR74002.1 DUF1800 domain-containing protein [Leeia aquatica]
MQAVLRTLPLLLGLHAGVLLAKGMGEDEARHLLNRTGFSPDYRAIQQYALLSREEGVDRLLSSVQTRPETEPPAEIVQYTPPSAIKSLSEDAKRDFRRTLRQQGAQLQDWWLGEMLTTRSPLTERLTLLWHNHFTSSLDKVKEPVLIYKQNLLLRQHALGNFGTLLHAVTRDPAMLVYLDNARSKKEQPNENYAREVMELFALGEGHYTEQDIREGARALTGLTLNPDTGEAIFAPKRHDSGEKTLFGQRGRYDPDTFIDRILQQPATAEYVTRRLWREFVSPSPDEREVQRLAQQFRQDQLEMKPLLRRMLLSPAFWDPKNRGTLVKSPVELVVGTLRQFQPHLSGSQALVRAAGGMGQELFNPPNVKGWPGGNDWINTATLQARRQFLDQVFRGRDLPMPAPQMADAPMSKGEMSKGERQTQVLTRALSRIDINGQQWLRQFPDSPTGRQQVQLTLLPLPASGMKDNTEPMNEDWLLQLVLSPAYQLK